jgi:hypothetical protein
LLIHFGLSHPIQEHPMKIGSSHLPPVNLTSTKAAKATGAGEQKPLPPGLERVQARLQSVPAADRNAGQASATDRITRNMARYTQMQAIVTPPVTTPAAAPTLPTTPTESTTVSTPTPAADTRTTAETATPSNEAPTA